APIGFVTGRLVVQGSNVSISIPQGKQAVTIGREDPVSGIFPDIDTDQHGGQDAGVGRRHAQLIVQSNQVYIEDLNSVNGTVVNKQRLQPQQPQLLNDGDEIRLGKMILIYHAS
ncbi:FHA domain-containing protein, partial [Chloroflexota bacterium]